MHAAIRSVLIGLTALTVITLELGEPRIVAQTSKRPSLLPDTPLQDLPEFRPRQQRSEADEDRILASTLFADGRLLYRREKYEPALRRYQRAYRYSNGSSTILAEIVPLAFRAGRVDEATRYALLAKPDCIIDPFILRRLAIVLTERERFEEAARIYEKTAALPKERDLDGASLVTQFELGRLYFLVEDFEKAATAFRQVGEAIQSARKGSADGAAVEALLRSPEVTFSIMAESFLGANDLDRAQTYFGRAFENNKALRAFHEARLAEKRNQVDEAMRKLQVYLESKEDDAGLAPYKLLAKLLSEKGMPDELVQQLEGLREKQPDNVFLGYFLAETYLDSDRDEMVALYRQLIETQPTVDAYRGLVQAYTKLGRDDELLEILAKSVSDLGNLSTIDEQMTSLAKDDQRLKGLFEQARKQAASQSVKARRSSCVAMALLALKARDTNVADEFFKLAAGEPPNADPQVWTSWGIEMLLADDHDRAVNVFKQMRDQKIGGRRRQGEVLFYLSGALAIDQKYDESLEAAQRAAELSKGVPSIQARPAWVHYLARRWDDAKLAYEKIIEELDDDQGPAARAVVREAKMTLSNVCVFLEQHEEAIEWLEQILDEYPGDVGAFNDLGYLWADQGQHLKRALRMVRVAAEAEPDNVAYLDSVGWALYRLGRFDEAVEQLRKAVATEEPDPIILDHLGDALLKAGNVAEARQAWQKAVGRFDDDSQKDREKVETKLEQFVLE